MNALVPNQRRSLWFFLLFGCFLTGKAQLKADFTATPRSGCSPLVVYFSDNSSGNPTHWKWDLGNGATSTLRNPSATYFNPGTYRVKLVTSNASGTDSTVKTDYITVYANPTPRFSTDRSTGCYPLQVRFSDSSLAGSGTIESWQWDFGDGTLSTEQHPVHTYVTSGSFAVTLRVTNSVGCVKTVTMPAAILAADGVKANFTQSNAGWCPAPISMKFTNQSNGSTPLQYHWDFGDNTKSNEQNPSHVYTKNGAYTVRLVVTNQEGCTDTIIKENLVKPGSAKADFAAPSTACINSAISLTNQSTPLPVSVDWDFGNGRSSSENNPIIQYAQAGIYSIRLISNFGDCADTVEKKITVTDIPNAGFIANQQRFCSLPATVLFTPTDKSHVQYSWSFGDGNTSTSPSPVHQYTTEGVFTVRLIVTNAGGCSDTVIRAKYINIQKPHLALSGLPQKGCTPLTITPAATVSAAQSINSYHWDFGDGSSSTLSSPSHTYTRTGTYTIRLVVTTAGGCTDSVVYADAVRVGEKPGAAFTHQPPIACSFEKVYFTDKSSGTVDQWLWIFGDGGFSTQQSPAHQFGDTGMHTVTLVVYNNTCADTIVKRNAVYIKPPIASFLVGNDCANRYAKTFTDKSAGAKTWYWEFGDGATSTDQHPEHTYTKTGNYDVKLTVTNGDCTHFTVKKVAVMDEKALFTMDTTVCRNTTALFTAKNVNAGNIAAWKWDFGDGSSSTEAKATSHSFAKSGQYTVSLTLTDLLGCKSKEQHVIHVFGPTADFKPSLNAVCLKDNVIHFLESSTPDVQHPIVKRVWDYGDTTIDSTARSPYQHSYQAAGTYTVSLTVMDTYGCRDSKKLSAAVVIAQPTASFEVSDTLACTNQNIRFTNTSTGASPSFQWLFGDGALSSQVNPVHAYAASGLYTTQLVATDKYGCKDSLRKPNLIAITYPKAKFSVSDSIGTCPPLLVNFSNQSTGYKSIYWNFGDGSRSLSDSPSHFYSTPGTYYAMLVVTGQGGCTDTATQKIVVKGPDGAFSYGPLTGCQPLAVNFTAVVKNTASLVWDFSDGVTTASKESYTAHTYQTTGDFIPKIILTDSGGCTVPIVGKDTIRIKGVTVAFELSASHFCNDGIVQFTNRTVSNDLITGYQWHFGDGAISTEVSPTHRYSKPGHYTVQLIANTKSGCSDTLTFTDTVKIYASPVVAITGDSAACAPARAQFEAKVQSGNTLGLQWQWNLDNGQTSSLQKPASQLYPQGNFTIAVVVTDTNGCRDTATKNLSVYPTPATNAGADQWICRGSVVALHATGATTYQWQSMPTLSCTDCANPLAAPTDSITYIVTGKNAYGCVQTDSVIVRVHQPFTLQVEKGDTICVGKTIRLAAQGADRYTWTPSAEVKSPTAGITTATPQTSTRYTVIAKDNANCFTDTASVDVKVWPIPVITTETAYTLSVGDQLVLKPGYSADVSSWQWTNAQTLSCANCPSPTARPKTETTYAVTAKNEGGCQATASINIRMICNNGNLYLPNTFSPNGDGTNDFFYPRGTGISKIKSLRIFNRWGELVFSRENFDANDAAAGWDGTFKGKRLPPDVFIYTCEVVCANNEILSYKGDISLLR